MTSLIDIQSQIQKLQKQASDIRSREFNKTVQEIILKMSAFGITTKDLQRASAKKMPVSKKKAQNKALDGTNKKKASTVPAKYVGPNNEAWSGRGITPKWLSTLVTQGRKKEDFLIRK